MDGHLRTILRASLLIPLVLGSLGFPSQILTTPTITADHRVRLPVPEVTSTKRVVAVAIKAPVQTPVPTPSAPPATPQPTVVPTPLPTPEPTPLPTSLPAPPPPQPPVASDHAGLMAAAGIAPADYADAEWLVARESGWNPSAVNASSGACGLAQALPCSKLGPAWNDPVTALTWMNGYVVSRYGSWPGATAHSRATGWY